VKLLTVAALFMDKTRNKIQRKAVMTGFNYPFARASETATETPEFTLCLLLTLCLVATEEENCC
jgi:hypothetical protein